MRETVITVESVTKKFKLYSDRPASIKERIIKKIKNTHVEFHALKDVSFEVKNNLYIINITITKIIKFHIIFPLVF